MKEGIRKDKPFGIKATYNPPTMGPVTGPINDAAANTVVAGPRPAADHISAMTPTLHQLMAVNKDTEHIPEEFVRGATAKKPQRKRVTIRVSILGAKA